MTIISSYQHGWNAFCHDVFGYYKWYDVNYAGSVIFFERVHAFMFI